MYGFRETDEKQSYKQNYVTLACCITTAFSIDKVSKSTEKHRQHYNEDKITDFNGPVMGRLYTNYPQFHAKNG